jgi:nucleoside-diphosphate-sugar epimerase
LKVLVTGGAGYVGSVLTQILLERGHDVDVLDSLLHGGRGLLGVWANPRFRFLKGDIRRKEDLEGAVRGAEAVVHLAAIVGDPACAREQNLARETNLEGSQRLLDVAMAAKVSRFVFASTCSNYGRMKDPTSRVDEGSELKPVSLYAEMKVAVEHLVEECGREGRMVATPLRFSTVYGVSPRMRFDLTVNEFTMEAIAKGKLVVFGEQFWRPYIHVRDAARAICVVLEAPAEKVSGRVFNVGHTDENYRKKDLVELILKEAPLTEIQYVHKEEDPRDYRVSFERIRAELGFTPERRVPEGVREVASLVKSGALADLDAPIYRNC